MGNDAITALQTYVAGLSSEQQKAFTEKTGIDTYILPYINSETAEQYCKMYNISLNNNIWGQSKSYGSNPIKNWPGLTFERRNGNTSKALTKQDLYIRLADINNSALRNDLENILQGGKPSDAFLEMLNERYEKHQEEFDAKWAEYQAAKGNKADLKATMLKLEKKYEGSESDYENSKVKHAEKDYKNAEIDTDVLLSVLLYMSHDAVI